MVVDTNVLVSGLLSPFSAPGEIIRLMSQGSLLICHDARILDEYREVLNRPVLHLEKLKVEALLAVVEKEGEVCVGRRLDSRLPDPDDEVFLEVALGGHAKYLITGNIKDYPPSLKGVEVILPKRFIDEVRNYSGR